MECYVYEHFHPGTEICFYVGKGVGDRKDRMTQRNDAHQVIINELAASGVSVDVRIVASSLSHADALEFEKLRIAHWTAAGVKLANGNAGGGGPLTHSETTRAKMRDRSQKRWIDLDQRATASAGQKRRFENPAEREKLSVVFTGRITSEETKKKLAITSTGLKHTEETKEKIRAARKAAGIPPHVREAQRLAVTGKKRPPPSEQTRQRMREAQQRRFKKDS